MKKKLLFLLFPIFIFIGLAAGFSASATNTCPTDNGVGVGCNTGIGEYYCGGSCRAMDTSYCPSNELTPVAPCSGLDACGVCSTCQASYLLCTGAAYPTRTCTYNDPAFHCATLTGSNCNAGQCATCVSGYSRCASNNTCIQTQSCQPWETFDACTNTCVGSAPTLKLNFDSVNASNQIIQSSSPTLVIPPTGLVGIGITNPGAQLEIVPTSGYAMLAGSYKIGNVALPTSDSDVATKSYVDSALAGGSGTSVGYWLQNGNNISNTNSGNVGIGTTDPLLGKLQIEDNSYTSGEHILLFGRAANASVGTIFGYYGDGTTGSAGFVRSAGAKNLYLGTGTNTQTLTILDGGNVGIGTTNPTEKLSVNGKIAFAGTNAVISASTINDVFYNSVHMHAAYGMWVRGATRTLGIDAITDAGMSSPDLSIYTNGTKKVTILQGGNVGIGLTNPGAKLEVAPTTGYAMLAGNYKIGNVASPTSDSDAATMGWVNSALTTAGGGLWSGSVTGNIWNMNSGNVGIGTTNPTTKIDVYNGHIRTYQPLNSDSAFFIADYGHASGQTLFSLRRAGVQFAAINGNGAGTGITITSTGTATLQSTGNGVVELYSGTGLLRFRSNNGNTWGVTAAGDGTLLGNLIVQGTGNSSIAGSVGIGITNPSLARLEIQPLVGSYGLAVRTDGAGRGFVVVTPDYNQSTNTGSRFSFNLGAGSGNTYTSMQALNNGLSQNANIALNPSGGNVGIGTTNPGAQLELAPTTGYAMLAGNYKIGNVASPTANADAATKGYVDSALAGGSGTTVGYWAQNGTNISNTNSGNVGIGTTNPEAKLDVIGGDIQLTGGKALYSFGNGSYSSANASWGNFYSSGSATRFLTSGKGTYASNIPDMYFAKYDGSTVTNMMMIQASSGNVGIGTTNPTQKLQISGNIRFDQANPKLYYEEDGSSQATSVRFPVAQPNSGNYNGGFGVMPSGTATESYVMLRNSSSIASGNQILGFGGGFSGAPANTWSFGAVVNQQVNADSRPLAFVVSNVTSGRIEAMRISNLGNVGIGTTNPGAKLELAPTTGYAMLAGSYKVGNVALPTSDTDAASKGYVDSTVSSATTGISASAVFVGSTASTYNGAQSGYSNANTYCNTAVAGSHVCTTGEILYTINKGSGASIPSNTTFWISNGPPAYTANANDCQGWNSSAGTDYGTLWIKLASGDGFGSLMNCNSTYKFACCK